MKIKQPRLLGCLLPLCLLLALQAQGAPKKTAKPDPAPKKTESAPAEAGAEQLLSDSWYTVTIAGKTPYGYYNDRLENRKGRLYFQNHYWKREEDFINEEQLGAYAEANADLTPLFFNYHSVYRANETVIDGTVVDGHVLTIKAKKAGNELPGVRKVLPAKTIFEIFFPVWLSRQSTQLKPGQSAQFKAVFEDGLENGFAVETGKVKMEKPDEFAGKSGTSKFTVESRGLRSSWWIDAKGVTARIDMPQQKIVVERVSKEEATSFLGGK